MKTIAQQLNIKTFPFRIEVDGKHVYYENSDGNCVYYEDSSGYWYKFENSDGDIEDNRTKSKAQSCKR